MEGYTIGIDLGGTKILTALIDSQWNIVGTVKMQTMANKGPEEVIQRIVDSVEKLLKSHGITMKEIKAIGIGAPGMINVNNGTVISAPNMPGWKDIALGKRLNKKFGVKVACGNDVNMGLLGELHFGVAKGFKNVVGLFVGTGIGGAVIIEGKLINGAHHLAGEVGHMVINKKKKLLCGCGKYGCMEASAGRVGIAKQIDLKIENGKSSIVSEWYQYDLTQLRSGKLKKALNAKDTIVEKIVKKASKEIGIGIANLINILDPELIVLGGGVIEALGNFMLPIILKSAKKNTINYEVRKTQILCSELGDNATVLGAASLAYNYS